MAGGRAPGHILNTVTKGDANVMHKHALKLFLLGGAVLAAVSCASPAWAQDDVPLPPSFPTVTCPGATTATGALCAILTDNTGTRVEVFTSGTANIIRCHNLPFEVLCPGTVTPPNQQQGGMECPPQIITITPPPTLCGEAFAICVNSNFAAGAVGTQLFNLQPGTCSVFTLELVAGDNGNKQVFTALEPTGMEGGVPVFDVSDLPLGSVVNVQVVNQPASGKSIGVQTTFQFRVGTCKLCKIRKIFTTDGPKTITQVKEFELPCNPGTFSTLAGSPGTAVASTTGVTAPFQSQFITIGTTGNTGINPAGSNAAFFQPSASGSLALGDFADEFCSCGPTLITGERTTSDEEEPRVLGVFLSFRTTSSSGVTIRPGIDKFITFCIDIE
jgi:hypothetical protein